MKISFLAVVLTATIHAEPTEQTQVRQQQQQQLTKEEDDSYWSRLLQETDMSVPTPTLPPTIAPKTCECDVRITCETAEDGIECNAFSVPTLDCATDLSSVRFLYTGGSCEDTMNPQEGDICLDSNDGPPAAAGDAVIVTCLDDDDDSQVILAEATVMPGETIQVTAADEFLPEVMTCIVSSSTLDEESRVTIYQQVQFNTQVAFTAKSIFGSLEVEQCDDVDCIVDVIYTYNASNVGEAPINITSMTRTRDGEVVDLTDQIDPKELDVGEWTIVQESDDVDYCVDSTIETRVDISSDGEMCVVNLNRSGPALRRNLGPNDNAQPQSSTSSSVHHGRMTAVGYYRAFVDRPHP